MTNAGKELPVNAVEISSSALMQEGLEVQYFIQ